MLQLNIFYIKIMFLEYIFIQQEGGMENLYKYEHLNSGYEYSQ